MRFPVAWMLAALVLLPACARANVLLLRSPHPEVLARFYDERLGLEVLEHDAASARIVLAVGADWLVIAPGREQPASPQLRLLLPTDDLVGARTRLESGGLRYSEAVDAAGEIRALYFRDPDGNLLGFAAPGTTRDWLTEWSLRGNDRVPPSGRIELAIWSGLHGVGLGFALRLPAREAGDAVVGLELEVLRQHDHFAV